MRRVARIRIPSAATTPKIKAMPAPSRWISPGIGCDGLASFTAELPAAQSIAARVLWHRGLRDAAAVNRFLNPRLEDLHDPMLLKDMDRAVDRLQRAISSGEKILLYGDY